MFIRQRILRAYIAPTAAASGDIEIGAERRILHGSVITAEGAPVRIGSRCVVMEQAMSRGAGGRSWRFPTSIYVAIGTPATTFQPDDTEAMMAALQRQDFARTVFAIDLEDKTEAEIEEVYTAKYVRALAAPRADSVLVDASGGRYG